MNDVIDTKLEAQSVLLEKGLIIIRAVYLGMKKDKGVYRVSIYIRTFFAEGNVGMNDVRVQVLDRTDATKPTFWAFKLDSFVPQGLNLSDFM